MKSKIVCLLILVSSITFSQTLQERKEIISKYDTTRVKSFSNELKLANKIQQQEIEAYLLTHNIPQKIKLDSGGVMELRKIVDGKPIYIATDNVNSAKSTRTNFLNTGGGLGLNLDGQNMHIATWDGGPTLATHQEFWDDSPIPQSRVDNPDLSVSNDQSDHSTHVSGTIIARGTSANAKGMAPKATLTSYDFDNDNTEVLTQATTNGLLISNHSYGFPINQPNGSTLPAWYMGCYDSDAVIWDNVAYMAPYYLMVASAGNDGQTSYTGGLAPNFDKLTGRNNSKNNLVITSANDPLINPNGSGQLLGLLNISSFSSQGPSDDGRIKPDLTTDGYNVYSCISTTNTSYATYPGTSMAAANASGTLLLLQQYYNQLHGSYMRSSTLKGLVCHTADDDNPGAPNGPDAIFGWGLLNAKVAAETLQKATIGQAVVDERTLNQGQMYSVSFSTDGSTPLSASICWTDPPGTAKDGQLNSSNPALVNNLDIRISDGSTTYLPWKLGDRLNPAAGATKADNNVDNVERVDILNPAAGTYTVTVSHKGTLTNALQNYALIITGGGLTLSTDEIAFGKFNFWPNPVNDVLHYSFNNASHANRTTIDLIDINGRSVYKNTFRATDQFINNTIDVHNLSRGIYIMHVQNGVSSINKKIIVD